MVPAYGLHLWSSYPFHCTCKNGHLCGVREEKRHIWHTCANIQRLKKEYSSNDNNPLVFGFCVWGGARISRWLINQVYQDIACEGWHKLYSKGDFCFGGRWISITTTWGTITQCQLRTMLNIEVFNACQMQFGCQKSFCFFFVFGALRKFVLCKVSTLHSAGLSRNCMSQNIIAAICK